MNQPTSLTSDRNRILKERAQLLAKEIVAAEDGSERVEVIEYELANERFAFELSQVCEVQALKELTPVPCTPSYIAGIVNFGGQILTVVNLKEFFGLAKQSLSDMSKVIVVQSGRMKFGVLADRLVGVRIVAASDIQPSLPTLTDVRQSYLRGVTADRLVILSIEKLCANEDIVINEQVEV